MANVLDIKSVATKTTAANEPKAHNRSILSRILTYFRSKRQAVKIMKALHEAEQIHSGKTKGKSFEQLFSEI